MRCGKCNIEFEGFFCPECGTSYAQDADIKVNDNKVQAIPEKVVESKQETNNISMQQQIDLERRTIRGRIYDTVEQAEIAREENNIIDRLKSRLLTTKSQKKRQIIMSEFRYEFTNVEAKERYALLQDKVSVNEPKGILICRILGISILFSILMILILGMMQFIDNPIFYIFVGWYAFGIWVWIIWKIILIVQRFSPYHYSNIKKI